MIRPDEQAPDWFMRVPSGGPGIASIKLPLELMLHVRLSSPDHFDAMVAAVRELSERNAELLAELKDGDEVVYGRRAHRCWDAHRAHHSWDDLLYVLSTYGAVEPNADEKERWDEALERLRERREEIDELAAPPLGAFPDDEETHG